MSKIDKPKKLQTKDKFNNFVSVGNRVNILTRGKVPNGVSYDDWTEQIGTIQVVKCLKKGNKVQVVEGNQIYDGAHIMKSKK